MTISRRTLLLRGGAAASVALAAGLPRVRAAGAVDYDVAIIGGGVAGAYALWRLKTSGSDRPVALFETSNRIGGRLFSPTLPDMPNLPAELGGMRYVISPQDWGSVVESLIHHLGFEVAPAPVGGPNNLYFLRGTRFQAGSDDRNLKNASVALYGLRPPAAEKTPTQIILDAIERAAPNSIGWNPQQWDQAMRSDRYRERPWWDWTLQELLIQPVSYAGSIVPMDEAFEFVRDALGYTTVVRPWNLADAMPWLIADFARNQGYKTIVRGMQALPLKLVENFRNTVFPGHKLDQIEFITDGFRLTFITGGSQRETKTASQVILALPPRALALIKLPSQLMENGTFQQDRVAVTGQAMTKVFMGFNNRWWSGLHITGGRSVTDLPIRQTYYFGQQQLAGPSLLMASYDDGPAHEYWASFRKGTAIGGGPFWHLTPDAIEEVRRQLSAIHGVEVPSPNPGTAVMADWRTDPFGGAYHLWNAGVKSWEVIPRIRQPLPDKRLFICGEAWSADQGWINGALQTTERLLQKSFNLAQPNWLPRSVYLGPQE